LVAGGWVGDTDFTTRREAEIWIDGYAVGFEDANACAAREARAE
jgi:hypothetical protein